MESSAADLLQVSRKFDSQVQRRRTPAWLKKPGERPFYYDEEGNIYTPLRGPSRAIAPDHFGALRDAGNLIESDRCDEAAGNSHVHSTLASMSR